MSDSTIASQIKKLRKSRGWTQPQLADRISVSKQTISNWETGLKVPRMGALQKLADLFNVPISEIVSDQMENSSNKGSHTPKTADLADKETIFTYEGKEIPPEDLEYMKRILLGGQHK